MCQRCKQWWAQITSLWGSDGDRDGAGDAVSYSHWMRCIGVLPISASFTWGMLIPSELSLITNCWGMIVLNSELKQTGSSPEDSVEKDLEDPVQ